MSERVRIENEIGQYDIYRVYRDDFSSRSITMIRHRRISPLIIDERRNKVPSVFNLNLREIELFTYQARGFLLKEIARFFDLSHSRTRQIPLEAVKRNFNRALIRERKIISTDGLLLAAIYANLTEPSFVSALVSNLPPQDY